MYATLNDATIVIPSADLRSIVLGALGVAQDNTTTQIAPQSSGVSYGGLSLTSWLVIGGIGAYLLLKK